MERIWVGIDWGSETHQVCAVDAHGSTLFEQKVEHTGEAIVAFCEQLIGRADGRTEALAVAIEVTYGAIVEALLERGLEVYAINPKQLDRFRDRHTVAGAKDDRRDAYVLADSLRTDQKLYRRLALGEPRLVELREMRRAHDELTADTLALANRLRELLRRYCPQVLSLGDVHDEPWLWELLELAPTPAQMKQLTRAEVETLRKKYRLRRGSAEQVVSTLQVTPLPVAPGVVEAASGHVALLLPRLRVAHAQRRACAQRIEALMAQLSAPAADEAGTEAPEPQRTHRDAAILLSVPGLGVLTGATMLAEAAIPLQARDYQSLRTQAGVAPVSAQTGKQRRPTVSMRRACNPRLREAVYHWARVSTQRDPHSRAHYQRLRSKGHSHGRALRGVADRLLAMLLAMLKSGSVYNPALRQGNADATATAPSG